MLKVHSGHRYRPHRTVRLRLNTQVREKEGRVRPFSVFEPHNREQTYASGIPFCSAYCPERTHKYTFYPIKMQEIPTKTSFMDNYSFAPPAVSIHPLPSFLSSVSCFCLLLPPPARRQPFSACRQSSTLRLPSASTHAPLLYAAPPLRTSPSIRAATNFPSRPRQTSLPGCDGLPFPAATDKKNATRRSH